MYQSTIQKAKHRTKREEKGRELPLPDIDDNQYFGVIDKMVGNGRANVKCEDGVIRNALICGSMRNKRSRILIASKDLVLVSHRVYEDKVDILFKYSTEECNDLIKHNMLPESILKDYTEDGTNLDDTVTSNTIVYSEV